MRGTPITVYDGHPDSPRLMYETKDGLRYTPEQWQLAAMVARLEKKLDAVLSTHGQEESKT